MNFSSTPEFNRELKTLSKKWRSLPNDIEVAKKTLPLMYQLQNNETPDVLQMRRDGFFNNKRATVLQTTDDGKEVVKMRLDCVSLGSKDIVRLVFVCVKSADTIMFVEIYAKNIKQREDQSRIKKYL